MADVELVIRIPEEEYRWIMKSDKTVFANVSSKECMLHAIKNGTPLPKGHGKIMDVDKIVKKMEEREEQLKDNRSMYETACVETAIDMFGETIVEADTEEREDSTRTLQDRQSGT